MARARASSSLTAPADRAASARTAFESLDGVASKSVHLALAGAEAGHSLASPLGASLVAGAADGAAAACALLLLLLPPPPPPLHQLPGQSEPPSGAVHRGSAALLPALAGLAVASALRQALAAAAQRELYERERRRESWELENFKDGECEEVRALFVREGVAPADAALVVERLSSYPGVFVDLMMGFELKLSPPDGAPLWRLVAAALLGFALASMPIVAAASAPAPAPAAACLALAALALAQLAAHGLGGAGAGASARRTVLASLLAVGAILASVGVQAGAARLIAGAPT